MTLLTIEEPNVPKTGKTTLADWPLFRLGFRPFYLLAATFAAISVPLWLARYLGWTDHLVHVDLNWHMHEMVFGFVIAVVIGFLYTAGRNWTGLWTPTKSHLAALAALWIAGRIAMLAFNPALAAIVDILFLPLATWPLFRVLQRAGYKRNMFAIGLLTLLTLANAVFHGAVLG
ncbi:MAG: NnrS family protein, partial [Burkholderiaceae bacterium]